MKNKILFIAGGLLTLIISVILYTNSSGTTNQPRMEKIKTTKVMKQADSRYIDYSPSVYESAKDKKRVLFFHAKWCPTCKAANEEFSRMSDKIPSDIILIKTDYDTETELKKKYAITYQHTFVQLDAGGNEITKWNGGGINELISNTN